MERLSRVEFEHLSADEQNEHIQDTFAALRVSIPHSGAAAGAFIDVRLYVQEIVEWAPAEVERLRPFYRAGIESDSGEIHGAFQEALDSGSLGPEQAHFAKTCLQAARRLIDLSDEYM